MKLSLDVNKMTTLALCLLVAYAAALMPMDALATPPVSAPGATIGTVLCNVADWFTGPIGQGIATLAIIVIGVGALMGKVSWGMAIIVGIGIAVIFGAPQLVTSLGGGAAGCA